MTLVLETGTGIQKANSYVLPAFVTTYLTNLGRATENSWSTLGTTAQEAACIAATSYIDTRWGGRFKGTKQIYFNGRPARALLTVSGQPVANDTLVVGSFTYTFVTAMDDFNINEIEIGADVDETISNISKTITQDLEIQAALRNDTTNQILLTSDLNGEAGNNTILNATGATNIVVTEAFQHGEDEGEQPLEFPRAGLFSRSGFAVVGISQRLKQATAEYAVRAAAATLYTDPETDPTGRIIKEKVERVGPIEEETVYSDGPVLEQLIKPYPAADRLIADYIRPAQVIR